MIVGELLRLAQLRALRQLPRHLVEPRAVTQRRHAGWMRAPQPRRRTLLTASMTSAAAATGREQCRATAASASGISSAGRSLFAHDGMARIASNLQPRGGRGDRGTNSTCWTTAAQFFRAHAAGDRCGARTTCCWRCTWCDSGAIATRFIEALYAGRARGARVCAGVRWLRRPGTDARRPAPRCSPPAWSCASSIRCACATACATCCAITASCCSPTGTRAFVGGAGLTDEFAPGAAGRHRGAS